jgi:hypothetical protein
MPHRRACVISKLYYAAKLQSGLHPVSPDRGEASVTPPGASSCLMRRASAGAPFIFSAWRGAPADPLPIAGSFCRRPTTRCCMSCSQRGACCGCRFPREAVCIHGSGRSLLEVSTERRRLRPGALFLPTQPNFDWRYSSGSIRCRWPDERAPARRSRYVSSSRPVPYIVNFSMVDGDGDGTISADEFKAGCAKGMVKSTQP